jgi:hypothetical protein
MATNLQDLHVDAGPAVSEELADIYADSAEDLSNDVELIILDHPAIDDIARLVEIDLT